MAANILTYNSTFQGNIDARQGISKVQEGLENLRNALAAYLQCKDAANDGSDPAHWATLASVGGFAANDHGSTNAAAKKAHDELAALTAAIASSEATIDQAAAIFAV